MPKRSSRTSFEDTASQRDNVSQSVIPQTFQDGLRLPSLFVFDLDYTLWPFWVDTHTTPPLRPDPSAPGLHARDRHGDSYGFYPEVPSVLAACRRANVKVAAASRTHTPELAMDLLNILHVKDVEPSTGRAVSAKAKEFFANLQIFPGDKITHMKRLNAQLKIPYEEFLFFDDEGRNRNVERELGVCFVMVDRGVDCAVIDEGVRKWRKIRGFQVHPGGDSKGTEKVVKIGESGT